MCCFVVSVNIPGSDRVRIREIVIFKFICNILTAACNVVDQGAYDRQIQNELVKFRVLSRSHHVGAWGPWEGQDHHTAGEQGLRVDQDQTVK